MAAGHVARISAYRKAITQNANVGRRSTSADHSILRATRLHIELSSLAGAAFAAGASGVEELADLPETAAGALATAASDAVGSGATGAVAAVAADVLGVLLGGCDTVTSAASIFTLKGSLSMPL